MRAAIASTSRRVARFVSCSASAPLWRGIGTPAIEASRSTASGKLRPSVSIRNAKMSPCLPDEKSWKNPFWSLTKKEGVFSALKGERPAHSRPCLRSLTRLPTTSDTGSRARISSRKAGVNFMGPRLAPRPALASRRRRCPRLSYGASYRGELRLCPRRQHHTLLLTNTGFISLILDIARSGLRIAGAGGRRRHRRCTGTAGQRDRIGA